MSIEKMLTPENLSIFIFVIAAIVFSIFAAFKSAFRGATQYWGVQLATKVDQPDQSKLNNRFIGKSYQAISIHGLRDALTTNDERVKRIVSAFMNLVFFVAGIQLLDLRFAILALVGILLIKTIVRHQLPEPHSEKYRQKIIGKLEKESRFYGFLRMEKKREKTDFFAELLKSFS